MRKNLFPIIGMLAFSIAVFAGGVGDPCNYQSNGDSECNAAAGIYCVSYSCHTVADTNIYCIDYDNNNLAVSGDVNWRKREYDGSWATIINQDDCLNDYTFATSCSGSLCKIREATCSSGNRVFEEHPCTTCSNGACTSWVEPPIGQSCSYQSYGDSQCAPDRNIFCVAGTCTRVTDSNTYCTDTDGNTLSTYGSITVRARQFDGNWSQYSSPDFCAFGTSPTSTCSGTDCKIAEMTCSGVNPLLSYHACNSCSNGACQGQDSNVVGRSCNYQSYGDVQCDANHSIYCTAYTCQTVTDTNTYCTDADSNNFSVSGDVNSRKREYDGSWVRIILQDQCIKGSTYVSNCSGADCKIQEATCRDKNTVFETRDCNNCVNGACLSSQGCNYSTYGDSQCDANKVCVSYTCQTATDMNTYCIDADSNSLAVAGDTNVRLRDYDGSWRQHSNPDKCMKNNTIVSSCTDGNCFVWEATCRNKTEVIEMHPCENCLNGACLTGSPPGAPGENCSNGARDYDESGVDCGGAYCAPCGLASRVLDDDLLRYITSWSNGGISNEKMLQLIDVWKNS